MGVHLNIGRGRFPKQGAWLGKRCEVIYDYNTTDRVGATVVRDDAEDPHRTILHTDDGRYLLSTECQHTGPE